MKKISVFSLVIILIFSNISFAITDDVSKSDIRAYLIGDYETGEILESYKLDEIVEIASITKLMTYMVVMDSGVDLKEKVVIDRESLEIGGSTLDIKEWEYYTIDDLLNFSLVLSANNATYRLASYISGSEEEFVKLMNKKAQDIGLKNAVFYNSTGLPIEGFDQENKMSLREVFEMSRYLIKNYPEVLRRTTIPGLGSHSLESIRDLTPNTNPLLKRIPGVDGLKTGYTNRAGYSLVTSLVKEGLEANEEDLRLISVVMGAANEEERNRVNYSIVNTAKNRYEKRNLLDKDLAIDKVSIPTASRREVELYPMENLTKIVNLDREFKMEIEVDDFIDYPVKPGEKIASLKIIEDNKLTEEIGLTVDKKLRRAGKIKMFIRRLVDFLRRVSYL